MAVSLQEVRREIHIALQTLKTLLPPSTSAGDVDGPSSAVNNNLVAFDGTTGKLIKDAGGPYPTGGAGIALAAGVVSIADFDSLPDIDPNPDLTELFVAIWNDQIGGFPQSVSLQDLLTLTPNVAEEGTSSSPDLITFFDVGSSANFTTTILNFLSDNVALIDHGGLGGLTDVDDHPDYLLVDGTRDLTGELDLNGNKLVLSADGLTSIQSLAPTFLIMKVNNVGVQDWQDDEISMSVPLTLEVNKPLTFSFGTELVSTSVKQLDLVLDGVDKVNFRETFTSFATDLWLNDNVILLSSTEEISGTGGVLTLKVANKDQVRWADNLLTLAESSAVGNVTLFTVKGADAVFEGSGGTLLFHGGIGNDAVDGTLQLATADTTVRLEIELDGTVTINQTVIDEDLITLGDGAALFIITSKSPATGAVPILTIRGADAISGGAGGPVFLRPGARETSGADGTVGFLDKDGVPILIAAASLISALQDLGFTEGKRIDFNTAKTTSIRGSATELLLEILGSDQFVMADDVLTLGDAGAAFIITSKSPATGDVPDLTIRGADAISSGDGGTLRFQGGLHEGFGNFGGSIQLATPDGTVRVELNMSGALVINTMTIASNGAIQNVPTIQIDDGGIIGFDNDNKWVITEDLLHSWTVNAVLALTLSDDTLDGQGTTRLTGFKGMRETFAFNYHVVSTITTQWTYYASFAISGSAIKRGAFMHRPGSIISIAITCDVNVLGSGDTLEGRAYLGNTYTGFAAELTGLTVANGLDNDNTQALGVDTFVRGDYLQGIRVLTGASPGQVSTDDFTIHIEVEYD